MSFFTIAIDGPSGAGKSSMAEALAERLGIYHLDTGAMYRAMACACLQRGCSPEDREAVEKLLPSLKMDVRFEKGGQRTFVNEEDLSDRLHTPLISMGASNISRHSAVRRKLVSLQRALAERSSFILDGRDIGTVVLPDAEAKFYLTASPEVRAQRRYDELHAVGDPSSCEEVLDDIRKRDQQDSNREDSPLRAADDAIVIESDHLSREEVLELMLKYLREKGIAGA